MENDYHDDADWRLFKQAIYNDDGSISWSERFVETDAEALET